MINLLLAFLKLVLLSFTWSIPAVLGFGQQGRHCAASGSLLGARLQSGKRVSISNPNSPGDVPVACGITSKATSYSVTAFVTLFKHNPGRRRYHRPRLQSTESAKKSRPPRPRFSFPRLVNLDDKPTLGLFAAGVDQSGYRITLKLLLCCNYTYI